MDDDLTPEEFMPPDTRVRVERVRVAARAVFHDDYKARDFLARPNPHLQGRRPIDLIVTGEDGTRRVERILRQHPGAAKA